MKNQSRPLLDPAKSSRATTRVTLFFVCSRLVKYKLGILDQTFSIIARRSLLSFPAAPPHLSYQSCSTRTVVAGEAF